MDGAPREHGMVDPYAAAAAPFAAAAGADLGDPDENAGSLANLTEVVLPCLDAIEARSVMEVGAYRAKLTGELVSWAEGAGARVVAIEPVPQPELLELDAGSADLELVAETSHEALPRLPLADAIILDGDHNYYTLSEELRLVAERASGSELPLLIFHDVGWPLARRDAYSDPDLVPKEHRHPYAWNVALMPGNPGVVDEGMPFACVAVSEGGPRNGVLTAIEDFMAEHDGLELATVPAFFGLGVVWHTEAPWADAVAEALEPWNRNPVLERLEANRIVQVAERWGNARRLRERSDRGIEQENLLRAMLQSNAFAMAERMSRLRQRGEPMFSREQVRRALGETND
jgi:hypothetical protein